MNDEKAPCTFYGGKVALALLEISQELLLEGQTEDFVVYPSSSPHQLESYEKDHPDQWIGPVVITEKTYTRLHHNLCSKIRKRISAAASAKREKLLNSKQ